MGNYKDNNLIFDREFRQKLRVNPSKHIAQLGIETAQGVKVVVKTNSKNIIHVPVPTNDFLAEDMNHINAAIKTSTAGTGGTAGTVLCVGSTISTAGTVGSVGSVACN